MGQFRLGISTMKTILALFGFFLTARALSGQQLKSCIDGCPVANRYRNCVSNCLSSQGGGGGIITQQGGVQNCRGQRCNQNNPGSGSFGGGGSFGSSTQNCQGSQCYRNDGGKSGGGNINFGDCFPFCNK